MTKEKVETRITQAQTIAVNSIKECETRIHNKNKGGAESALGLYKVHAKIAGTYDEKVVARLTERISALP